MNNSRMRTRCYYTDYVNHMIRFYLSTPTGLDLQKRQYTSASVNNWSSVQLVFNRMDEKDAELMREVFACDHYLPKAVEAYCKQKGIDDPDVVWRVITRVSAKIARVRGLM